MSEDQKNQGNIRQLRPNTRPEEDHSAHPHEQEAPTPVIPVGPQTLEGVAFRVGIVDNSGRRHSATLSTTLPPFSAHSQSEQTRLNVGLAAEALLESIGCRLEAIEFASTSTVEL